jgi:glutamate dehydrogenase
VLLCDAFQAEESEFTTFFSESILARISFVLKINPANSIDIDVRALEEEVVIATMSWQDHLNTHLIESFGEEEGNKLAHKYANAFPPGYCSDFKPRGAIEDIRIVEGLKGDDIGMSLYRSTSNADGLLRFRLLHCDEPLPLYDIIPVLENFGLKVESEHPYGIECENGDSFWIHEFTLNVSLFSSADFDLDNGLFQDAFLQIWLGEAENDSFNRLILGAGLAWREIAMLRAYAQYMKQIQFGFSNDYIADTLCNHLDVAKKIVQLFYARFELSKNEKSQAKKEQKIAQLILESLDSVTNLGEDRIIRQYLLLIEATLRTNFFQRDTDGNLKNYFSFKLSPNLIPDIPLPAPMFEIFVSSPQVEGVHLRGGKVSRGGLRWSDRMEDFRTEVLGLVKAQQVKNAVIVPAGAKGGFVAKSILPTDERSEIFKKGVACYKIFIQALIDITDNLVAGEVVPPVDVVRKDEDDTYLVVAADKGTATFSDMANEIAMKANFWLGDAFASGGSVGYDHKKMRITAKGAWVSVQRHFREMGIDVQHQDFSVVGIGDMAGDVFGNGMLLSEHIQLVCAFNHMHIFIDPNPDAAQSFQERKRLFELSGSSWKDYNETLISSGGGVFLRSAKSIEISAEMKSRFDINEKKLTPNELIHRILKAPVDLLWNGGIGTYVKSSSESDMDVGDKASDALRVNGNELRVKVIGEGGNLGMTQLGRIEYCLNGGRSNTDFIDNAAGVDCSDHEVNIKILLNNVVDNAEMTMVQRNRLLEKMTDNVSALVLANNYHQTQAISLAEREVLDRLSEYQYLMTDMQASGKLNRALEFIPTDDELKERKSVGKGLTRPELSVLISYVKSQLKNELVDSSVPDDKYLSKAVETAFPELLNKDFNNDVHHHRLRREIIATQVANDIVNNMGIVFVNRMRQSTAAESGDIVRAYTSARDIFSMPELWQQIEALDYSVDADVQMALMTELMRLVRRGSRWFLRNRRVMIEPAQEIKKFKVAVDQLKLVLPNIIDGGLKEEREKRCEKFVESGVSSELAYSVAGSAEFYPLLGIIDAANEVKADIEKVAELYFKLSARLQLDWFLQQISQLKTDNQWQMMAREAYRDDLEWQLRTLTTTAIRHLPKDGNVDTCLDNWLEKQAPMIQRWKKMLIELQGASEPELAMFSVAIRELLNMAQTSKFIEV